MSTCIYFPFFTWILKDDKLNNILRKSSHDDNSNNSYHKLNGYNNFLSSPQKSYWKNSINIRINPKSLAPEYYHYQKYLNGSGSEKNNNNEKQKLPKIEINKKKKKIIKNNKKIYSKNYCGIGMY